MMPFYNKDQLPCVYQSFIPNGGTSSSASNETSWQTCIKQMNPKICQMDQDWMAADCVVKDGGDCPPPAHQNGPHALLWRLSMEEDPHIEIWQEKTQQIFTISFQYIVNILMEGKIKEENISEQNETMNANSDIVIDTRKVNETMNVNSDIVIDTRKVNETMNVNSDIVIDTRKVNETMNVNSDIVIDTTKVNETMNANSDKVIDTRKVKEPMNANSDLLIDTRKVKETMNANSDIVIDTREINETMNANSDLLIDTRKVNETMNANSDTSVTTRKRKQRECICGHNETFNSKKVFETRKRKLTSEANKTKLNDNPAQLLLCQVGELRQGASAKTIITSGGNLKVDFKTILEDIDTLMEDTRTVMEFIVEMHDNEDHEMQDSDEEDEDEERRGRKVEECMEDSGTEMKDRTNSDRCRLFRKKSKKTKKSNEELLQKLEKRNKLLNEAEKKLVAYQEALQSQYINIVKSNKMI